MSAVAVTGSTEEQCISLRARVSEIEAEAATCVARGTNDSRTQSTTTIVLYCTQTKHVHLKQYYRKPSQIT